MVTPAKKKTSSMDKKKPSKVISKNDSQTKTKSTIKVAKTSLKKVSKKSQNGSKKNAFNMGTKKASFNPSSIGKPSSFQGGSTGFSVSKLTQATSKNSANTFKTAKSHVSAIPSKTALKDNLLQKKPQNISPKIANIKPGTEVHTKEGANRRQEVLRQLREKLGNNLSTVEKSTKTGKGVVLPSGPSGASGDSVKAGFNALSMSQIDTHIQSFTLRFVDLIICCMVIDNYLFGTLIFCASLAEIVIGWVYIEQCTSEPTLPYVLMVNGVLNIIEVHMRNLANQRLTDYFVSSIFRLMAFFSFVYLIIILLTIDESMTIWYLPKDAIYVSNKGIIYCSKVLYYFTYYLAIVAGSLILGLTLYTIVCIGYMHHQLGGRRIHGSRISSAGPSSKGSSGSLGALTASVSKNSKN